VGRWTFLTACRTQCDRQKGSDDCSRSRLGNLLRGARRQMRLETAAPSNVNGRPLTVVQIQCTRQIETDTVQFGGSCILSDTVQSSGFQPCASLAAYNSSASVLAKKNNTAYLLKHPLPILFNFCGRRYGLVTAALPASMWSKQKEHTARRPRTRPKHQFFRENRFWCFEGSWERKRRSQSVQTPSSHFFRPLKLTAARNAATSPWGPVYLLTNFLCALSYLHPINSIEAKKPHQDGREHTHGA